MNAPLPVTCVHISSALGGSERVLLDFATRAVRHGIAAHVILPKEGPLAETLREAGAGVSIAPAEE